MELGLDMCRLDLLIKFVDSTLVSIHQRTYSYSLIHKTTFFFTKKLSKIEYFCAYICIESKREKNIVKFTRHRGCSASTTCC